MSTVLLVPVALALERSQSPLSFVTVVLVLVVLDTWAELLSAVLMVECQLCFLYLWLLYLSGVNLRCLLSPLCLCLSFMELS
jgi:hypothetical protein